MIEKEKKFLVEELPNFITALPGILISQGYLILSRDAQLRVRTIVDENNKTFGYICYKKIIGKEERLEYEYEIPFEDAYNLLEACEQKLTKYRRTIKESSDYHLDIDIYPNINNLIVCEIEYRNKFKNSYIPEFCTKEITGVKKYSNIFLAKLESQNR